MEPKEPTLHVFGGHRRRPGRPRAPEPSRAVCVWLPASAYDRLIALAAASGVTVSRYLAQLVVKALDANDQAPTRRDSPVPRWHEHKYIGGPPPERLRRMQLHHEVRARKMGVAWDCVDLRLVYAKTSGICGICKRPVPESTFTVDHIRPMSRGGPHVLTNLQPAHAGCNTRKGNREHVS
jgi:5-methylcytosine-specific restriction endonuclease McrA